MDKKHDARHSPGAAISGVLGLVLYLATGFLYISSGLVVPGVWLILIWVIWLAGIYLLVRVFQTARAWTPLVAVGAVAFWWIYVSLGEYFLDWTA